MVRQIAAHLTLVYPEEIPTITAFNGDRWPVLQVLPLTGH